MSDPTNSEGLESISRMIKSLRALPRALTVELAPKVAEIFQEDVERSIAAGTAPDGTPWKPRAKDGSRPLEGAASHVYSAAVGSIVYLRVKGIEARHHRGTVKGKVKRPIIYEGTKVPKRVADKVIALQTAAFQRVMSGGDGGSQ